MNNNDMQSDFSRVKIFIVEDDLLVAELYQESLHNDGFYNITVFRNGTDFLSQLHENPDIVTLDFHLPDYTGLELLEQIKKYNPLIATIFISSQEDVSVVVDAYKKGINDYIIKNRRTGVELVNTLKILSQSVLLRNEVERLREQLVERYRYSSVIGDSPAVLHALRLLQKAEKSNILTLITGETGTGKDVFAKALHFNSDRKKKPFVAVNITAIPDELVESELFGHEKGAFTGATSSRIGKFEEANGGSIFLDEIGDMNFNLQTKLLCVLQDRKITKLGGNKEIKLDVRIIAATNKNLGQKVKEKTFRDDLYYRLQGFFIHLPPLKERGNDIILLANYFLTEFAKNNNLRAKKFDAPVVKKMLEYKWPGNIRELKSLVERAALMCDSEIITEGDLIFSDNIV